ncbi:unnamed protein product [Gemmata massiliana]|uniref:Uncharacterized protein n=1 Tax=Gemmata massiliana TaxID=1210884 RepID=A0A6P2DKA2_9BACT|nr:hypothetical protein [Gemmata massiliana]VTS00978.1 unnamed protein product [Gemmata massiliana]
MNHLVRPIANVDLATCYSAVVDSLAYLKSCVSPVLGRLSQHLDGPAWAAHLKREKVRLVGLNRPAAYLDRAGNRHEVIGPRIGAEHNFIEVINQASTLGRMADALKWFLGSDDFRSVPVVACHPTTSSVTNSATETDNDLMLGEAPDRVIAAAEVSDVIRANPNNNKVVKDLCSLGALLDSEVPFRRGQVLGTRRLFLVVSEELELYIRKGNVLREIKQLCHLRPTSIMGDTRIIELSTAPIENS